MARTQEGKVTPMAAATHVALASVERATNRRGIANRNVFLFCCFVLFCFFSPALLLPKGKRQRGRADVKTEVAAEVSNLLKGQEAILRAVRGGGMF